MRCKKHLQDLTSTIGVCASCLRERLEPLEAQAQAQQARSDSDDHRCFAKHGTNPNPPSLNFPRSVSPYVTHRKTGSDSRREKLFHSTPQVSVAVCDGETASSKRKLRRLWILSSFFRSSRSNKTETSSRESRDEPSPSSSPWFTTILKQNNDGRRCLNSNLQTLPAVNVKENLGSEFEGRDRSESAFSSGNSPHRGHHSPAVAQRRSRLGLAGKSITNMAFCLSPLVRVSPNRNWSHKGLVQEMGVGGVHHVSNAASFCSNRSRKIVDFGRVRHNR